MTDPDLFAWRAPLEPDWMEQWGELDARVRQPRLAEADAIGRGARRLANQRLGLHEQLKLEGLARRFLPLGEALDLRSFRIGLLSNRTLGLLVDPLRAAGLARGMLIDAVVASHDSVVRFAFDATDVFAGTKLDAVAIVLDSDAFARPAGLLDSGETDAAIGAASDYLHRLAAAVRGRYAVPAVMATIPPPTARISSMDVALPGTEDHFTAKLNAILHEGAASGDWILWDLAGLAARVGGNNWFDPVRFHEAKLPFAVAMHPLAADHLCRILAAVAGKSCRALILDLDDTLWGGVIGDDGVTGIRLGNGSAEGEAFLAFQRFLRDLRRRGVVLAVCSRNSEAIAREPFRMHPDMALKEDDFAVFQANWDDKAVNLQAIAGKLGLGLDTIAFADDNPAERARIRQALPSVSVPELGADPAWFAARIADSGVFEHLRLSAADLGRAASYSARAAGEALRGNVESYRDHLRSLQMTMTVGPVDRASVARVAQLLVKSNQFNLTARRYSEPEILQFASDDVNFLCWQARLDDKFAAHGLIAAAIVRKTGKTWIIDNWVQSCRVLGRGVEEALMNTLVAQARAAGAECIIGEYVATSRNAIVADLFPRLGFSAMPDHAADALRFDCLTADCGPQHNEVGVFWKT